MNYIKNQNLASIFFLMFISQYGYADDISEQALPTVTVKQKRLTRSDNLLKGRKTSDRVIKGEQFRSRGSTIGEALNQELGIHANSFGAGASAPIIRGQEGKRIRVLHNHAETGDMSNMSPDHAVMVDSILAKQIEVLRGTPTLLYSSGNSAGVVNVIDNKIPLSCLKKVMKAKSVRVSAVLIWKNSRQAASLLVWARILPSTPKACIKKQIITVCRIFPMAVKHISACQILGQNHATAVWAFRGWANAVTWAQRIPNAKTVTGCLHTPTNTTITA
ncbi:TonB-dependent receptor plug domain-containing protein [Kingella kingae]|uniref:TonB-dependent receptor plug domain-containing protein n=1 Tax=Kingella kingae TaxID=504 RepID=UPI003AB346E9